MDLAFDDTVDAKVPLSEGAVLERVDQLLTKQQCDVARSFKTFMYNHKNRDNMKLAITIMFDHYTHEQVRDVLLRRYNIVISDSGMRKNCKKWGLSKTEDLNPDLLLLVINEITADSRHVFGYRAVYSIIQKRYALRVSQAAVRIAMSLAFPEESRARAKSTLHRREYNGDQLHALL